MSLADRADVRWQAGTTSADPSLVVRAGRGGAIQAVDIDGLVAWARAHSAEIAVPRLVGDFVQSGAAVLLVYGGHVADSDEEELAGMIALGEERTFDQDPAFALRVMVDIANKALSPAVNDPTTAVQVIDHIGEVLSLIGSTDLERPTTQASEADPASVVLATRPWEDFVVLALTEIREFGATSVQVLRRLRALLEDLLETVRPEHRAAIQEELRRLDATVAETWSTSVDLDRASRSDRQGLGSPAPELNDIDA